MLKKITAVTLFAGAIGMIAANAHASTYKGHVTAFSPVSITVLDKEAITVRINEDTVFTKLITRRPWQESTTLTAHAVRVGDFAVVHVPNNDGFVANWVQVSTDRVTSGSVASVGPTGAYTEEARKHFAEAQARRANPTASESKRPGAVDTALHCERLAALGTTTVVAPRAAAPAPVNDEAAKHRAEAANRRANPTASESKRPGSVDTAAHCDRIADELEKAAK